MTTPDAPDPRKVAEAALDVFVYAPMGLALEAKDLLPKLAERGRNQVVTHGPLEPVPATSDEIVFSS